MPRDRVGDPDQQVLTLARPAILLDEVQRHARRRLRPGGRKLGRDLPLEGREVRLGFEVGREKHHDFAELQRLSRGRHRKRGDEGGGRQEQNLETHWTLRSGVAAREIGMSSDLNLDGPMLDRAGVPMGPMLRCRCPDDPIPR
ncbi:MAG: hypothetical protein IT184_16165 [Acidobacteria bacterium]|nr:hypothetical protein [Acidobacteriota bacterium]